jgi:hypothetical protein
VQPSRKMDGPSISNCHAGKVFECPLGIFTSLEWNLRQWRTKAGLGNWQLWCHEVVLWELKQANRGGSPEAPPLQLRCAKTELYCPNLG